MKKRRSPSAKQKTLLGIDQKITRSLHTSGQTVGTLYALSTLGSIVGTLLTSFYLITVAGVRFLIMAQGILLLVISIPLLFMKLSCKRAEI